MEAPCDKQAENGNENCYNNESQLSDEEQKEREHFMRIINAFKYYKTFSVRRVQQAEKNYQTLSKSHQELIPSYLDHLDIVRACIEHNYEIIKLIIKDAETVFENKKQEEILEQSTKPLMPLISDMDKIKTTLKQFVRDWSDAGRGEREVCYNPVIDELKARFPPDTCDPSSTTVLVPGAGLGRLAYEIARLGYSCQGNEWSLFMLFASNFVLNKCHNVNSFTLYPWIHQWTNNMQSGDQIEPIRFPDVDPSDVPPNSNFSMAAGDFLEVYQEPEMWDCIVTVFFIDTAHNIIDYIETIKKILKPGGIWINLGPLLYHYADLPMEMSIELSYEDVRKVIEQTGFIFEKEETHIKTSYTQNPKSMLQYSYDSVMFVVKNPS